MHLLFLSFKTLSKARYFKTSWSAFAFNNLGFMESAGRTLSFITYLLITGYLFSVLWKCFIILFSYKQYYITEKLHIETIT